jgi:FkbM family methyltransferase
MKFFNYCRSRFHPIFFLLKFKFFLFILKNINFKILKNSLKFGNYYLSLPRHIGLYLTDSYMEEETFEFIDLLNKDLIMNSTFIDIGGNVGLYSLYFKKKYNSKIFIFEPDNNNLELLYKTSKKNKLENFHILPFAVSDENKIKNFLLDEYTGATGTLENISNIPQQRMKLNRYKNVLCVKLDDLPIFELENISVIKIDTEGHELKVINGSINLIKKYLPIIIVESDEIIIKLIEQVLLPLNYKLKKNHQDTNYIFYSKKYFFQ